MTGSLKVTVRLALTGNRSPRYRVGAGHGRGLIAHIVIDDGADALPVDHDRVRHVGDVDEEGLARLVEHVAVGLHGERVRRSTRRDGLPDEVAGHVVDAGRGRAVGGGDIEPDAARTGGADRLTVKSKLVVPLLPSLRETSLIVRLVVGGAAHGLSGDAVLRGVGAPAAAKSAAVVVGLGTAVDRCARWRLGLRWWQEQEQFRRSSPPSQPTKSLMRASCAGLHGVELPLQPSETFVVANATFPPVPDYSNGRGIDQVGGRQIRCATRPLRFLDQVVLTRLKCDGG